MSRPEPNAQLERSYRRVFRLFPGSYRRRRGEELMGVLLEMAEPGQRRPPAGETAALLGLCARTWLGQAVSPSRRARYDSVSILAVTLPVALVFPAVGSVTLAALTGWSWPFGADVPAWGLWVATAIAVIAGSSSWPRWLAALGTVAYLFAMLLQFSDHNYQTVAAGVGWLAVQVVALAALWRPERVRRGRELMPVWVLMILAGVCLTVGAAKLIPGDYTSLMPRLMTSSAAMLVGVALCFALLFSKPGRALLPILGALAAVMWAAKYQAGSIGNFEAQRAQWLTWQAPTWTEVLLMTCEAAAITIAVFLGLRLFTAAIDKVWPTKRCSLIPAKVTGPTPVSE